MGRDTAPIMVWSVELQREGERRGRPKCCTSSTVQVAGVFCWTVCAWSNFRWFLTQYPDPVRVRDEHAHTPPLLAAPYPWLLVVVVLSRSHASRMEEANCHLCDLGSTSRPGFPSGPALSCSLGAASNEMMRMRTMFIALVGRMVAGPVLGR